MSDKKVKLKNSWNYLDELCDEPMSERVDLYDLYYEISTKIYNYRVANNWSQKKLAEVLGVTQAMVSKLESGEYNYTVELLWKIAKKLGWKLNISFEGAQKDKYSVISYEENNQEDSKISLSSFGAVG